MATKKQGIELPWLVFEWHLVWNKAHVEHIRQVLELCALELIVDMQRGRPPYRMLCPYSSIYTISNALKMLQTETHRSHIEILSELDWTKQMAQAHREDDALQQQHFEEYSRVYIGIDNKFHSLSLGTAIIQHQWAIDKGACAAVHLRVRGRRKSWGCGCMLGW